jgi:uncharacterized protein YyaL (SSP411 family)
VSDPKEVAFTGPMNAPRGRQLRSVVAERLVPNRVVAARVEGAEDIALLEDKPDTAEPTAYVCERYVCKQPTTDPDVLAAQLAD